MPPAIATPSPQDRLARVVFSRRVVLAVGALAVAFCVFAAIDATEVRPDDGTVWLLGDSRPTVLELSSRAAGTATPLRPGDVIEGIANRVVASPREAAEVLGAQEPGATVPYLIAREGRRLVLPVPLSGFRTADRSYLVNVLLAAVYLLIGFLVFVKSHNDRPARLFFLLCLTFAVYFMTNLERSSYFWGDILTRNGGALARFLLPAFFLQFFLVFPEKKTTLVRHPWLSPVLYLLPLLFYAQFTRDQFFGDRGAQIGALTWIVLGFYYLAGLAALLHSYLSDRDPLLRERVRILTWGTLVGVVPFLVIKIGLEEIVARSELAVFGVVPLVAIPVSFGYCVARYQVLQIEFLVKRSLLYAVLSGLLLLAWAGLVFWSGSQLVTVIDSANPLLAVGVTLVVAAALWPLRTRLQHALEARLYRSRANLAALLEQFSREIPGLIQQQALLDHVGTGLRDALEVPAVWFYTPQPEGGEVVWRRTWPPVAPNPGPGTTPPDPAGDEPAPPGARATADPPGVRAPVTLELAACLPLIEARLEPFWIDPAEARGRPAPTIPAGEPADAAARRRERHALARSGVNLLVPLAVSGRVIGLVGLPGKPGGEPYALHEVQLLTIVAGQAATQLENTRLYEEEVAKRKLEEEMRLARAIQSRLLPAELPTYPGLQIDAVNLSSKAVSGDYYDMIPRQDGKLVMIIADVSGKGMPASLLASNLQASLRAQSDICDSPAEILDRVNRQLHAATDSMHFATVFLAFLDPDSRRLVYCSGGHDAPVLLRADGTLRTLTEGGLPVGAFDFGTYGEEEVVLEDGDLLLLYTDGLTETRRPDADEEYGAGRLGDFLRAHGDLDVCDLLPQLDTELQRFRGRREADDDITLVALKVAEACRDRRSARARAGAAATPSEEAP
jgi:sigma-B regulation protein RsbU (phosphoserine phosphatase)